jgi:hypothetical protein
VVDRDCPLISALARRLHRRGALDHMEVLDVLPDLAPPHRSERQSQTRNRALLWPLCRARLHAVATIAKVRFFS